jgi:hypothetical protein
MPAGPAPERHTNAARVVPRHDAAIESSPPRSAASTTEATPCCSSLRTPGSVGRRETPGTLLQRPSPAAVLP